LGALLREHHDVRSLLGAARLQLECLQRGWDDLQPTTRLAAVERALVAIAEITDGITSRALGDLSMADDIVEIDPVAIVESAVSVARDRFPDAIIDAPIRERLPKVLIFGGDRALAHVIVNLLLNACEGDGGRRAHRVAVRLAPERPARRRVLFEFADDGPGLRPALLGAALRGGLTTKAQGTGLGLSLIAEIVESSGGEIAIRNLPSSGACVSLWLRCVPHR
jgi:signal transduction histidine kinase